MAVGYPGRDGRKGDRALLVGQGGVDKMNMVLLLLHSLEDAFHGLNCGSDRFYAIDVGVADW